eukprot:6470880-Amphidinium_carterae.1
MSSRGDVRTLASVLNARVVVVHLAVDVVVDDDEERCVLFGVRCSGEYVLVVDGGCEWEAKLAHGGMEVRNDIDDCGYEVLWTVCNEWNEKVVRKRDVRTNHMLDGCRER